MSWLHEFEEAMHSQFPQVLQTLEKSFVNNSHIDRLERKVGSDLPIDWVKFYQKWAGQTQETADSFQFGYRVLLVDEVLETISTNKLRWKDRLFEENWGSPNWIPWLSDDEGGLVVDAANSFHGQAGQIIELWYDWDERNVEFASLKGFHQTKTKSLKDNLWLEEEGNILPKEDQVWNEYSENLNPGYSIEEFAGPRSGFDE